MKGIWETYLAGVANRTKIMRDTYVIGKTTFFDSETF